MKALRHISASLVFVCMVAVPLSAHGAESAASEVLGKQNPVEYRAEDFEDPFGTMATTEEPGEKKKEVKVEARPLPPLSIQGLIWGGNFPQAIVNEQVVKIGDTINEVRIVDIKKEGLVVSFQGQEHNIPSPSTIYKPEPGLKPEGGSNEHKS